MTPQYRPLVVLVHGDNTWQVYCSKDPEDELSLLVYHDAAVDPVLPKDLTEATPTIQISAEHGLNLRWLAHPIIVNWHAGNPYSLYVAPGSSLTSLEGCPETMCNVNVSNNRLSSLAHAPKISGVLDVSGNPIKSFDCDVIAVTRLNLVDTKLVDYSKLDEYVRTAGEVIVTIPESDGPYDASLKLERVYFPAGFMSIARCVGFSGKLIMRLACASDRLTDAAVPRLVETVNAIGRVMSGTAGVRVKAIKVQRLLIDHGVDEAVLR